MHRTIYYILRDNGPPEEYSGTTLFLSMNDEYYAHGYVITLIFSSGTGSDQSARGLAVLVYV